MDARYLRVKNQAEHQHYDPTKRIPPWIKLYNKLLGGDDAFTELSEMEQWQLVRIWIVASRSSRFTLDENSRLVQVIADDEQTVRRAIQSVKKVPLAKFVREGWLIPVEESELVDPTDLASKPLAKSLHGDSKPDPQNASAPLRLEVKKEPKAVTSQGDAAPARVNGNGPGSQHLEHLALAIAKEMPT